MASPHRLPDGLCFRTSPRLSPSFRDSPQFVIFLVFGLPESPRYLYKHGRNDEALEVLCQVYGGTPDSPKISKEQADVLETIRLESEYGEYRWSQLLKKDEVQTGRRVLLAVSGPLDGVELC